MSEIGIGLALVRLGFACSCVAALSGCATGILWNDGFQYDAPVQPGLAHGSSIGDINPPILLESGSPLHSGPEPGRPSDKASAREEEEATAAESDWRFTVGLLGILPMRIKGSFTAFDTRTKIKLDASDILDNLDSTFQGKVEARYRKWSLYSYVVSFTLSGDGSTAAGPLVVDTDLEFTNTIFEVGGTRELLEFDLWDITSRFDVVAGARYFDYDAEVTVNLIPLPPPFGFNDVGPHDDWWDGIFGGQMRFDFTDRLNGFVRGTVGGFGWGASSDLSWNIVATLNSRLAKHVSFTVGYKVIDVVREGTSTKYDLRYHGPLAGFVFDF